MILCSQSNCLFLLVFLPMPSYLFDFFTYNKFCVSAVWYSNWISFRLFMAFNVLFAQIRHKLQQSRINEWVKVQERSIFYSVDLAGIIFHLWIRVLFFYDDLLKYLTVKLYSRHYYAYWEENRKISNERTNKLNIKMNALRRQAASKLSTFTIYSAVQHSDKRRKPTNTASLRSKSNIHSKSIFDK